MHIVRFLKIWFRELFQLFTCLTYICSWYVLHKYIIHHTIIWYHIHHTCHNSYFQNLSLFLWRTQLVIYLTKVKLINYWKIFSQSVQVNIYQIDINFFHLNHKLTSYFSAIVFTFTVILWFPQFRLPRFWF